MKILSTVTLGLSIFALMLPAPSKAQDHDSAQELQTEILRLDDWVFERGYNNCEISVFEQTTSSNFEFYHDQGGVTEGRDTFINSIRRNVCGEGRTRLYRQRIPGTSRVFPLHSNGEVYGALHHGDHNFYTRDEKGVEALDSTAAFTTLWILEDGEWKMRRVVSYDHVVADSVPPFMQTAYRAPLFHSDDDIEFLMDQIGVPILAMSRIRGGEVQQLRVFGELGDGRAAPVDTLFKVASLTKPVTALLTLKLVEAGLWDLDEPLADYYVDPDVADAPELRQLTTRHVLRHRTGFANWRWMEDDETLRFQFAPGERQQYSGEGMEYLRRAIEARFNRPMEDLVQDYIFDPLGMANTHFAWTDEVSDRNYAHPVDSESQPVNEPRHTEANAAANLLTTVDDYSRFMTHVMAGGGLSEELFSEMLTPSSDEESDSGIPYGLGWEIIDHMPNEGIALQHTGSDPGVKTIALMLPHSGDGVLLLTNSDRGIAFYAKVLGEQLPDGVGDEVIRRNLARP